jgi:23S rRNA (cytidine1920-2'-O)/16S rRNA (cytidine1409-2'-O)-methyltransferase
MMKAIRLDVALVEKGFFASRAQAQAAIAASLVQVNGAIITKPAYSVPQDAVLTAQALHPYVSRAALKLKAGLEAFKIEVKDKICLDIGASTGGFTQILLEQGAAKIYAVDVGKDQLHPLLRAEKRVISLESQDARTLTLPEPVDILVSDVSFISLTKALPCPLSFLKPNGQLVLLIKPQFELTKENISKGGLVRDKALHEKACQSVQTFLEAQQITILGHLPSPIVGGDGNVEFLIGGIKCSPVHSLADAAVAPSMI